MLRWFLPSLSAGSCPAFVGADAGPDEDEDGCGDSSGDAADPVAAGGKECACGGVGRADDVAKHPAAVLVSAGCGDFPADGVSAGDSPLFWEFPEQVECCKEYEG